ncbi:hypothetical protein [Streptomyces canus]|uniref:hypothetical protein n=1 Tax=Streptomyces canus TaxID=58343 RepID=UPI00277FC828|nr:hypothetical protein [Streptomyces canus]MDQ0766944.1 hypothetical protein [Streptomyces canus]
MASHSSLSRPAQVKTHADADRRTVGGPGAAAPPGAQHQGRRPDPWLRPCRPSLPFFALNGTDHRSHEEQNAAIAAYVRWRNARANPKMNFAPASPIRSWSEYPAKAA